MNELKDFQKLKEYFDLFDVAVKEKNVHSIINCSKLIESTENSFIESYHARKKEGVYYTNKKISKFIFSEALILFLNKKLENNSF